MEMADKFSASIFPPKVGELILTKAFKFTFKV